MAFFTITVTPDLPPEDRRRAVRAGPPAVSSRSDSAALLKRAGFDVVSETDVTDRYLDTARAWIEARDRHRTELEGDGGTTLVEEQRDKRAAVEAIEAGWLRRRLLTAVPHR